MFDITQADKNLKINSSIEGKDLVFYDVRQADVDFYGLYEPRGEAPFRRMPLDVAKTVSKSVYSLSQHTSGGRIRFKTDSKTIAIHVVQRKKTSYFAHMTFLGSSGFDLYRIENGKQVFVKAMLPPINREEGYSAVAELRGEGINEYILHFPLYDWVTELYLGLEPGAVLEKGTPYTASDKPVVFYGASITQGGCASRPGLNYCPVISRWLDADFTCLGFSGSCLAEPEMAQYLATLDASVFVLNYDGNAPDPAYLRKTYEPLFQTIRKAHPETPVILTSNYYLGALITTEEDQATCDERRAIIKETYDRAIAAGDKKVWYVDSQGVFEAFGGNDCTVDGCHSNDLGFYLMAKSLEPSLRQALGLENK